MIHLDDVQAHHLSQAYEDQTYQDFIQGLASTIRSRWFDRMWVTLEYIQGKEILMLSQEFEISDVNASDLSLRISNVAAKYVKRHGHGKFMQDVVSQNSRWVKNVNWTDMESWKSRLDKPRTFGAATHILGLKQCREP
ncbi:Fc.00g021810.m01.CDS01 [Cosmosporella sp. VM-42]